MEELKKILEDHGRRYPLMEPGDAVKLIYQNEFGGGHMIRDEASCLDYLRREYAAVPPDPEMPLYEPIGNGILRIHLAPLPPEALETLGRAFIRSSALRQGSPDRFREKLAVLRRVTEAGAFPFGVRELEGYLDAYARAGFPPVSHSEPYRAAYRPAYRIVLAGEFSPD